MENTRPWILTGPVVEDPAGNYLARAVVFRDEPDQVYLLVDRIAFLNTPASSTRLHLHTARHSYEYMLQRGSITVGSTCSPEGIELYLMFDNPGPLYAVNMRFGNEPYVDRSRSHLREIDTSVGDNRELKAFEINRSGEFLTIAMAGPERAIYVFRTSDLGFEAKLTEYQTLGNGRSCLLCFNWNRNSSEECDRSDQSLQRAFSSSVTNVRRRSDLGASAVMSRSGEGWTYAIGEDMQLHATALYWTRTRCQSLITLHNLKRSHSSTHALIWDDHSPSGGHSYGSWFAFGSRFDKRWVVLSRACGQFRFVDTMALKGRLDQTPRKRGRIISRAVTSVQFDGSFDEFYLVCAGLTEAERRSASGPMLVMTGVCFRNQQQAMSERNWLMEVVGNEIVPVVPLSHLADSLPFTVFPDKLERIEALGFRHSRYRADLRLDFPRDVSFFSPNENFIYALLNTVDKSIASPWTRPTDTITAPTLGHGDVKKSWLDVLAEKAPQVLGCIGKRLNACSKVVLAITYPRMAMHVLEDRALVHGLLASWARCENIRVPAAVNTRFWLAEANFSELAFELLRAFLSIGDCDIIGLVAHVYKEDVAGARGNVFLRREDECARVSFATRLSLLESNYQLELKIFRGLREKYL